MKKFDCVLSILTLYLTLGLGLVSAVEKKPNVVLFLIDDLAWADLGHTGSKFHETPRIDRLAAEGVFFSDAYAANPVCSPTRASVMLGKYPSRVGITNHSGSAGRQGPNYKLNPPVVKGHMPKQDVTLAQALKEAGYATAHIGKWHLQDHHMKGTEFYPRNHGFDLNVAGHKMGQPGSFYFPYKSKNHPNTNVPGLEDGKEGDYLTDVLTSKAIEFINEKKDEPFFLNLWYYTVHTPIIPRKDKVKKYEEKAKAMGINGKTKGVKVWDSESREIQNNAPYASMVESMDENIGRILDALEENGLEEDTIVVFLSDNGGLSTGTGPNCPTSSFPLKAGKAWVYEGGIRTPLIIKYPKKLKSGQTLKIPAVSNDVYPTVLDLAGIALKPEQHVDGLSLKQLMTGQSEQLEREAIYIHYPHYHHICSMGPAGAVRMGDYKLVIPFETGKVELYDLAKDVAENVDLADVMPAKAAKMHEMFNVWVKDTGSLMPTENSQYIGTAVGNAGAK